MIWIIIKAAIVTFALWCSFKIGRGTAIYELEHYKDGHINEISDDLMFYHALYNQFRRGESK